MSGFDRLDLSEEVNEKFLAGGKVTCDLLDSYSLELRREDGTVLLVEAAFTEGDEVCLEVTLHPPGQATGGES